MVLHILAILKTETNSEHLITQKEIARALKKKGIICRRYAIERNIEVLREFGYDIVTVKGTGTYLKDDGLTASDVFVLLEGIKRANFALENDYVDIIKNKLVKNLNKFELEELKNKNMIV